jgi:hypothetical protein
MMARFWAKVAGGDVTTCWTWLASLSRNGYGRFSVPGQPSGYVLAHRWAYEQLRSAIPAGLVLDHLCRNTRCVNPWHLEPVTKRVNALRGRLWESEKTRCVNGHPFDAANTRITKEGHRSCRACAFDAKQRFLIRQSQRAA